MLRTLTSIACLLSALAAVPVAAAPARKPASRAAAPAKKPAVATVTSVNLGATLKGLGLATASQDGYQRLRVEEERFSYLIDLRFSDSGEWLVCMAHLSPVPDLSKVPAAPVLALLSTNDNLLGMSFSYNRTTGQIMLNQTIPGKGLTPTSLRSHLEKLRAAVLQTQGLWDATKW